MLLTSQTNREDLSKRVSNAAVSGSEILMTSIILTHLLHVILAVNTKISNGHYKQEANNDGTNPK